MNANTTNTQTMMTVRNLTSFFDKKADKVSIRQSDAGFAKHDPEYNKLSLYINCIPTQIANKDGIQQWRFSIPLKDMALEENKFYRLNSLRRYFKKSENRYGYISNDAGYAIARNHNERQFLNIYANELPAQTMGKDGVLRYRFEVLLGNKSETAVATPQVVGQFADNDEDIPF